MTNRVGNYIKGETLKHFDSEKFHSEPNGTSDCDVNNNSIAKDLICAVCHAEYQNPKLLPCLHTFCGACLEKNVECIDGEYNVKCPLCSTLKKIKSKSNGLEELLSNFTALNLLDTRAINVDELGDASCTKCNSTRAQSRCSECAAFLCVNCQRAHKNSKQTKNHNVCLLALLGLKSNYPLHTGDYCRTHAGQKLTHFCKTCDCAVCNDCTFLDHPKDGHVIMQLSEISPIQRRQLAESLSDVQQKAPYLERTLLDIDSVLQSLPDNADAVAREITRTTENFIEILRQRQEELLDELTTLCAHKAKVLHHQKLKIQSELEILEDNCETTEKILRNGSNSEIATVHRLVYKRLEFLRNVKLDVEADENSEFGYDSDSEKLTSDILSSGKVFSVNTSFPFKVIGDGLQDAAVGKFASFTVGKSEKCEFSPGDLDVRIETPDSVLLECDVTHSGNLCNVVYNPKVPGEHEISVTIGGEHVPDSPICVNVKEGHVDYTQKRAKCFTFGNRGSAPGSLNQPCDVAVQNNGHILVADTSNHRVQIFDAVGKFISNFGEQGGGLGQLSYPSSIAVSPHGHVVVSDHINHRVQIFTSGGVYLRSFGDKGSTEGLLNHPIGIAVDEEGHIMVVDKDNHRVQVFHQNGIFIRHFGCYGSENGQLDRPMYAAISPDGDIFITDSGNHRVQIFDANGRHRETFGKRGRNDGEFYFPTGITIDAAGFIVVSDQTARIQVFNFELEFVTKLEPRSVGKLECPRKRSLDNHESPRKRSVEELECPRKESMDELERPRKKSVDELEHPRKKSVDKLKSPRKRSVEELECLRKNSVVKLGCPMGIDCTPEGKIVIIDKECCNVKILHP